jgi:CubicO group peptidase (beta-lactamase class C family)
MIYPTVNDASFARALASARPYLNDKQYDVLMLGTRQFGQERCEVMSILPEQNPGRLRETPLMIFSVTKAIVGTAIARMVDQRLLQWDDPLHRFIPELKAAGGDFLSLRVEDVFLHRSGLKDLPRNQENIPEIIAAGFEWAPHSAACYRTSTYQLIRQVLLCVAARESAQQVLEEWIFTPCAMSNSSFQPPVGSQTISCHYDKIPVEEYCAAEVCGAGLWSTCNDLMNFAEAVITPGRLMSQATFEAMREADVLRTPDKQSFQQRCRGWNKQIVFNHQPQRGFLHGGAAGSLLWCDPEANLSVVLIANRYGAGNECAFNCIGEFYAEA